MACATGQTGAFAEIRRTVDRGIISPVQELKAAVRAGDTSWKMLIETWSWMKSLKRKGDEPRGIPAPKAMQRKEAERKSLRGLRGTGREWGMQAEVASARESLSTLLVPQDCKSERALVVWS